MNEISVFSPPKESYYINVQDWKMAFAGGKKAAAGLISFFENEHKFYLKQVHAAIEHEKATKQKVEVEEYREQTYEKMQKYLLGFFGRNVIIREVEWLESLGVLQSYATGNQKRYKFNPEPIQEFIDTEWNPFLKTVDRKRDNPLEIYLQRLKINAQKVKNESLKINAEPPAESLKINAEPGFQRLKINHIDNKIPFGNKDLSNKEREPDGSFPMDFSEEDEKFIEAQREGEGITLRVEAKKEKKKKVAPKKKKSTPSINPIKVAATNWDAFYRSRKKTEGIQIAENEGIVWSEKEFSHLKKLLAKLASKAKVRQQREVDEIEAASDLLPTFLENALHLDAWYMGNLTPSSFNSHFQPIYDDVIKYIQTGQSGRNNRAGNGRNGHSLDAADAIKRRRSLNDGSAEELRRIVEAM